MQGPTVSPVFCKRDGKVTADYYAIVICVPKKALYKSVQQLRAVSNDLIVLSCEHCFVNWFLCIICFFSHRDDGLDYNYMYSNTPIHYSNLTNLTSECLMQIGGSGVLISPLTYIFDEETPRWRELLSNLGL